MTIELETLLRGLSTEAGVVAPVATGTMGDAVVHHLDDGSGAFVEELTVAENAGAAADQLEDLAERADTAAATDDVIVAQVSAESLNREYNIFAKAKRLTITSDSFESGVSDAGRLKGLARDARAQAEVFRTVRETTLDFSPEGKLMEFLRRDGARLEMADKDLDDAIHLLTPAAAKFKDSGVFLNHDGFRRFLTVGGEEVSDLAQAFSKEIGTITHLNQTAVAGLEEVNAAAKKLLGAGVKAGIAALREGKHFANLQGLGTSKGGLLGNFTLVETAKPGSLTGLSVPVYDRKNEHSFSKMGLAKGAGTTAWYLLVGAVRHAAIDAAVGDNKYASAANRIAHGASDVHAATKGKQAYSDHVNKSGRKTAITYQELVTIANGVKSYSKFTSGRVNLDDFEATLKSARKNTETLSAEEKSDLKAIVTALEDAAARIMRLENAIYNQAVYTTIMVTSIIKAAIAKID